MHTTRFQLPLQLNLSILLACHNSTSPSFGSLQLNLSILCFAATQPLHLLVRCNSASSILTLTGATLTSPSNPVHSLQLDLLSQLKAALKAQAQFD